MDITFVAASRYASLLPMLSNHIPTKNAETAVNTIARVHCKDVNFFVFTSEVPSSFLCIFFFQRKMPHTIVTR